jgi:hypothetical protein
MKCKEEPCPDGKHDFYPDYLGDTWCSTPYCQASEGHCRKCGWFISSCLCGAENGASKRSNAYYDTIERKRQIKKRESR